jgi:RNA polymerase sigma factor (sigma-70 family)
MRPDPTDDQLEEDADQTIEQARERPDSILGRFIADIAKYPRLDRKVQSQKFEEFYGLQKKIIELIVGKAIWMVWRLLREVDLRMAMEEKAGAGEESKSRMEDADDADEVVFETKKTRFGRVPVPVADKMRDGLHLLKKLQAEGAAPETIVAAQKALAATLISLDYMLLWKWFKYSQTESHSKQFGKVLDEIRDQFEKADDLRDLLVHHNLRLVIRVVSGKASGEYLKDVVMYGSIGLMRAVAKFSPEYGNQFSTMAVKWIRQAVGRETKNNRSTIRMPVYIIQNISSLSDIAASMGWDLTDENAKTHVDELVAKSHLKRSEVMGALENMSTFHVQSLSATPNDDSDHSLGDTIAAEPENTVDFTTEELDLTKKSVLTIFFNMNPVMRAVLALHCMPDLAHSALDDVANCSFDETSGDLAMRKREITRKKGRGSLDTPPPQLRVYTRDVNEGA